MLGNSRFPSGLMLKDTSSEHWPGGSSGSPHVPCTEAFNGPWAMMSDATGDTRNRIKFSNASKKATDNAKLSPALSFDGGC